MNPGDQLWINKSLLKDNSTKSQVSNKLSVKRFGSCREECSKAFVALSCKTHDVVNAMYRTKYSKQPSEISAPIFPRPDCSYSTEN